MTAAARRTPLLRHLAALGVLLTTLSGVAYGQTRPTVPTSGPFRALVVFARFADDDVEPGCSPAAQAWADRDALPPFAQTVLARTPTPPFPPTSLTAYFFEQSERRFRLYGDVYPRVVVSREPEAAYGIRTARSTEGLTRLTEDLLGQIDPDVDFGDYDANDDGTVDHVFIVLRRNQQSVSWTGYSLLGRGAEPLRYDGVRLDWNRSGSYVRYGASGNIFPELNLTRLMAHELGHDLWAGTPLRGTHLAPLRGRGRAGDGRLGYALMVGGATYDARGDLTISAFERDALGWIDCVPLRGDTTVVLHDLYTGGGTTCATLPLLGTPSRTLYLSNRQRLGPFDRLRLNTCTDPPNAQGLKDTGLLVTLTEADRRLAIVPADGALELSPQAEPYAGDLFGPDDAPQLTPWTRPTSHGRMAYPDGFTLSGDDWLALDRIRYTGTPDSALAVDVVQDYRSRPVVRQNARVGWESDGAVLRGDLIVDPGATLSIAPGTTLRFTDDHTVVVRGTLHLDDARLLRADHDEGIAIRVRGAGRLLVSGERWTLPAGSTLDLGRTGQLIVENTTVDFRAGALLVFRDRGQIRLRGSQARLRHR